MSDLPLVTSPGFVSAITGFPLLADPYTNIQPFTYRDGLTYLEVQECLREWLQNTLSPAIDANMTALQGAWDTEAADIINAVNAALDATNTDVAGLVTQVNGLVASLNAAITTATGSATAAGASATAAAGSATAAAGSATAAATSATSASTSASKALTLIATVNAKDYGAVGDGVTDDTAAIQAALNALPAGGGTIVFPVGNYICNGSLTVASYTEFVGVGKASKITYTGTGTFIALVGKREVHWEKLFFTATGDGSTLFSLSNTFRCDWRSCYLSGLFTGPATTGAHITQIGIVLTANSGDNDFINGDITNFGIGIKTDSIQNGVNGGKFGTNNVSIYGFGGGGMSINGYTDFVSTPGNTDTHIKIDGATGQWWINNIWIEGCNTAIQVGSNTAGSINGPSQFVLTGSKIAATTIGIDIRQCRNPLIFGLQIAGDSGNTATPTPVAIDATNAPEGVMYADTTTGSIIDTTFPLGWLAHIRSGSTSTLKAPNVVEIPLNGIFKMGRNDGALVNVLSMSTSSQQLKVQGPGSSASIIRFQDSGANPIAEIDSVAGAVNYPALTPGATTTPAIINARGTDTDIGIKLAAKGAGVVSVNAPLVHLTKTTGTRPSAVTAGVGAMIYDTTLSKPVFSDGAVWRDATGTAV